MVPPSRRRRAGIATGHVSSVTNTARIGARPGRVNGSQFRGRAPVEAPGAPTGRSVPWAAGCAGAGSWKEAAGFGFTPWGLPGPEIAWPGEPVGRLVRDRGGGVSPLAAAGR